MKKKVTKWLMSDQSRIHEREDGGRRNSRYERKNYNELKNN